MGLRGFNGKWKLLKYKIYKYINIKYINIYKNIKVSDSEVKSF